MWRLRWGRHAWSTYAVRVNLTYFKLSYKDGLMRSRKKNNPILYTKPKKKVKRSNVHKNVPNLVTIIITPVCCFNDSQ